MIEQFPSNNMSEMSWPEFLALTEDVIFSVSVKDKKFTGQVNFASQCTEAILGYPGSAFSSDPNLWFQSIHPEDIQSVIDSTSELFKTKKTVTRVYRFIHGKTQKAIWLEDKIAPQFDQNGDIRALLGIARDITLRKNLEAELLKEKQEAQKANQRKTIFLSNVGHELRTPLNSVIGFSYLLVKKKDLSKEKFNAYLENILSSSKHLLGVINDLLDIQKIESGTVEVARTSACVESIVKTVCELFFLQAEERAMNFSFSISEVVPKNILLDEEKYKRILINLISNAFKYSEDGRSIFVSVDVENNALITSVQDQGVGIPSEKLALIFRPFEQVDNSMERKKEGSGLGLSIVEGLVHLLGGKVTVKSQEGQGSEFAFSLPIQTSEDDKALQTAALSEPEVKLLKPDQPRETKGFKHQVILMAEDHELNRIQYEALFAKRGVCVHFANDGFQAVEQAKELEPDIIFMDVHMPGMDGIEATKCIRANEKLKQTPIIALTADTLASTYSKIVDAGVDDVVSKPMDSDKVNSLLDKYINYKKQGSAK